MAVACADAVEREEQQQPEVWPWPLTPWPSMRLGDMLPRGQVSDGEKPILASALLPDDNLDRPLCCDASCWRFWRWRWYKSDLDVSFQPQDVAAVPPSSRLAGLGFHAGSVSLFTACRRTYQFAVGESLFLARGWS